MSETKPTPYTVPGPYKAAGRVVQCLDHGRWHSIAVCDSRGYLLSDAERDLAAFIVRACNAHDDLVAALKELSAFAASVPHGNATGQALKNARAALAKARGE